MEETAYEVIQKIDEGSFGDIFSVICKTDKKVYAMKQIKYRGKLERDPYIVSEIQNLSAVVHDNIIGLYDILISSDCVSIIMELAELGNLENFIKKRTFLSAEQIESFYCDILTGVNFCHASGIAHRDLTPSNILLTTKYQIRIADFGLSMRCRNPSGEVILCKDYLGNSSFLAKEVIEEIPHDAIPADIWTLGVLLYYMVFSNLPFNGDERRIVCQHHNIHSTLQEKASEIREESRYFLKIMNDTLIISPEKRTSVSHLLNRLSSHRHKRTLKLSEP